MVQAKIVVLFVLFVLCVNCFPLSSPVSTNSGIIQGIEGENFLAFLGIPYAEAPLGNLRFASPSPKAPFAEPFKATKLAPACPQKNFVEISEQTQSEDCLFLNIFTPRTNSTELYPVLFYIHGGGWQTGSGMIPLYWGENFANDNTGVILVTINYRLGALGWLVSSSIGDQNFGFKDQQLAMIWVQENIQSFGGDPTRVTIAGQSAGGMSIGTHLTVPSSYPLFSRAIIQSGPPMVTFPTTEQRYGYGDQFSKALGCDTTDVSCLRSKNVSEILQAQGKIIPLPLPLPLDENPSAILFWMPVIDGEVILGSPQTRINNNQTAFVPTAWGTTRNETAGYVNDFLPFMLIEVEYDALLAVLFGRSNVSLVKQMYPARTPQQIRTQISQISCDYIFTCSLRYSARAYANAGAPVHKYVFLHPPSSDPRCNGTVSHCANIGETCHGAELDYVFHSAEYAGANYTTDESQLSMETLNYWISFIKGEATTAGWPQYIPTEDNNLALDLPSPYVLDAWRQEQCDFWDSWGYYGTTSAQLLRVLELHNIL